MVLEHLRFGFLLLLGRRGHTFRIIGGGRPGPPMGRRQHHRQLHDDGVLHYVHLVRLWLCRNHVSDHDAGDSHTASLQLASNLTLTLFVEQFQTYVNF